MSGARACRRHAPAGSILAIVLTAGSLALGAVPSSSAAVTASRPHGIRLPAPVREVDPLTNVNLNLRPDRLRTSHVPGTTSDREDVVVEVGPTGAPTRVLDTQRLVIHGQGNYVIRELGPARAADGIGDTVPPVLELGTVVWQGFSPGRRELAARLTLDPTIEAARLPMQVRLSLERPDGSSNPWGPAGRAPADGTAKVTLTNQTSSTRAVDTGLADLAPLVATIERLRAAAAHPRTAVPPAAGAGLPTVVPGDNRGERPIDVVAPLHVAGTLTVAGTSATVSGPGTTPIAGGVRIDGTLHASVTFTVPVRRGERLALHLDVRPWRDVRSLDPPKPFRSWRLWAAAHPDSGSVAAATDTLVAAAAASAHAAEYSPYLQANTPGPDLSTSTYVVAAAPTTQRAGNVLKPRPGAIALTVVAALAIVGNAALLRRRL